MIAYNKNRIRQHRNSANQSAAGRNSSRQGFTLVEMVIVIAITGIIAAVVAVFIRNPVQGYFDSVARADLTDVADTALRRMERDLRLALPNSIRTNATGPYLELLLTKTGGRYLGEEETTSGGTLTPLSFTNAGSTTFDVLGQMSAAPQNIVAGDFIVVYNLGTESAFAPANAYDCTVPNCNRSQVQSVAANTVTLVANRFAAQTPLPMESPAKHFQVVTEAVTYTCDGNKLVRHSGYTIQPAHPVNKNIAPLSTASSIAVLANGVTSCTFDYDAHINNSSLGLVGLRITLQNSNGESVTLAHQVRVENTP
jgi:MSHA biogenesis protein MshO